MVASDDYEAPLDPALPIVDPHMHLWDIMPGPGSAIAAQRYLFDDFLGEVAASGHNITHSVFVECGAMYRADGPPERKVLGETEFANGVAAMSASGGYGPCRIAHRIVASADLRLGAAIAPVLEDHARIAGERFCGIRLPLAYSQAGMFGHASDPTRRRLLYDAGFREGAAVLARMGLTLDGWLFHTQLPDLIDFADALPDLGIVLDHIGTPEKLGNYAGRAGEARKEWARDIRAVAERPNIVVKIGGMGMDFSGQVGIVRRAASSQELAERWRPYVETCIAAFGLDRCMFESNFPPDRASGSYGATWNAFKRLTAGASETEKDALFSGTAARVYRMDIG